MFFFTAKCSNKILHMDANSDIKRIIDALENLKQRHIGQYLENIIEFCQKEDNWKGPKTGAVFEQARK